MALKKICVWLFGFLLCHATLIYAQDNGQLGDFSEIGLEELYGDDELVSIATGSQKPIDKAPAIASVITAKRIAEMGARNLNEILETVPGLHVGLSAINRLDSVYSIRGIHTGFNPQVLLLMNGVAISNAGTGSHPILFRLPVASISRIEVIRGPGSAIYGADAYSGVINIITKTPTDLDSEIGSRIGSFNSRDAWLNHNFSAASWNLGISFEWQSSDGDTDRTINSDYQTTLNPNLSLAPGPLNTGYEVFNTLFNARKGDFSLNFWNWQLVDAGVGAGGSLALDPLGTQNENLYLLDLGYRHNLADGLEANLNLNYMYYESDSYFRLLPPGSLGFTDGMIGAPSGVGQQSGLDLVLNYSRISKHRIRFGSGFKYQEQDTSESKNYGPGVIPGVLTDVDDTPYVYMPDTSRTLWYLSLQDEWNFAPDWEMTTGVRYDHYSDFGSTINPRMALVWSTRHNLTTKLLYGRAFRAPSFQEQFADQNPVTLGNPDLDPETIDTLELAFDFRPTFNWQTTLNLFGYRADGLIDYVPAGGGFNVAQNARDQKGYGFELEASWEANETVHLSGNYAWQYSIDCDSDSRIPDAPGQQAYVSIDWRFMPNWAIYSQLNWIGSRYRARDDSRDEIDDYFLLDVTLRRTSLWHNIDLVVKARNLLDENALEPSDGQKVTDDYPLEGRSLWCELRYRF